MGRKLRKLRKLKRKFDLWLACHELKGRTNDQVSIEGKKRIHCSEHQPARQNYFNSLEICVICVICGHITLFK